MTTDSRKQNHVSLQRLREKETETTMDTKQAAHMGFEHQHAVVIGGSLAGLLAASVLSAHFGQVSVIEQDRLPDGLAESLDVPQGRDVPGLLEGMVLLDLFPDLFLSPGTSGRSTRMQLRSALVSLRSVASAVAHRTQDRVSQPPFP